MLHLLNAAAEAGTPVLLAGRAPPARWPTALPDLASRLRALTAVPIAPPDDELLRVLLASLFQERRLPVPEDVQDWMRQRLPRRAGVMREAAERLDLGQLAAHTKFTRRLAADCLAPLLTECDEISDAGPHDAAPPMPLL
jgi:chromosomal replication initiation ATPase DnaA